MEAGPGHLNAPGRGLAAGVAVTLVTLTLGAAVFARAQVRDDDRERDQSVAAAGVAALERSTAAAAAISADVASQTLLNGVLNASSLSSSVPAAGVVERRGDAAVVTSTAGRPRPELTLGADLMARPEMARTLRLVQETGTPRATPPVRLGDTRVVYVAHPDFGAGMPATTEAKREALRGWIVTLVAPDRLVAPRAWGELGVAVTDAGTEVHAVGGRRDDALTTAQVDFFGRAWKVDVFASTSESSVVPWIVLAAGLAFTLVVLVALLWLTAQWRAAANDGLHRARHLERLAQGGRALHQSLDLEELLPAFTAITAEIVPTTHLSVRVDDQIGSREVFRTGGARSPAPEPTLAPASARAGEAFAIPLSRGWRTVGMLTLVPARRVDEDDMLSLQALADVLAAALANAEVLRREKETVARLAEVDRLKDAFLGTVSHELRTSVTAVTGFSDLLTAQWESLADPDKREFARRVGRNAASLRALVDQLLDVARLEQPSLRVAPAECDLAAMVRATVDHLGVLLPDHLLTTELDEPVPAYVDAEIVERVVANLLSNAAKYSPRGSVVTVAVRSAGDFAELVVTDQGPGVSPADRALIFTRFYRGDSEAALATRGAGIGLAVVKELMEKSGGSIHVESARDQGARFVARFPLPRPRVADDTARSGGADHEPA